MADVEQPLVQPDAASDLEQRCGLDIKTLPLYDLNLHDESVEQVQNGYFPMTLGRQDPRK